MIYKIIDLKAVEKTGAIYVLVHFWETRGTQPVLRNDFYMALRDQDSLIVVDGEGYVTTESGRRMKLSPKRTEDSDDPFVRETVKRDVPAQMRENIEAYWKRAVERGETGDRTWPVKTRPKLTATDAAGILARPDVAALKGREFERADVHA